MKSKNNLTFKYDKFLFLKIIPIILFFYTTGCGTQQPFTRGESLKHLEGDNKQKTSVDGTEKKSQATPTPNPEPTPNPTGNPEPTPEPTTNPEPTPVPTETPPPKSLSRTYFVTEIQPLFEARMINGNVRGCSLCHGNKPFIHSYEESAKLVKVGFPEESDLYLKAIGASGSGHMKIWATDSEQIQKLLLWISGKEL